MQALEKLTLAYLALQERADKLQADKDAMQQDLSDLQHKYKTAKEQKAFLQKERNKWFDAYNLLVETNEEAIAEVVEQSEHIHNLKACIEELESQLVALTPKEQRIDEPMDGYEAEKRVCRQHFKASETTEKTEPIILLRVGDTWSDDWIKRVYIDDDGDWRFDTCEHALDAKAFNDLHEVNAFLGDLPLNKVFIFVSRHDPKTRHIIGEGYIKTK